MTQAAQTQTKAEARGKGFGPNPKEAKDSAGQTSDRGSQAESAMIDSNIAGMRSMANDSLDGIKAAAQQIRGEYLQEAQQLSDDISQLMFDISSGRLIFETVADNVSYLLEQNTREVEKRALGKQSLQPLSLKRLRPATPQDLSLRSLKGGE